MDFSPFLHAAVSSELQLLFWALTGDALVEDKVGFMLDGSAWIQL